MPKVAIAEDFLEAYAQIPRSQQKKVRETALFTLSFCILFVAAAVIVNHNVLSAQTATAVATPTFTITPDCGASPTAQFTLEASGWPGQEQLAFYWDNQLLNILPADHTPSFQEQWTLGNITNGRHAVVAVADSAVYSAAFTAPCPILTNTFYLPYVVNENKAETPAPAPPPFILADRGQIVPEELKADSLNAHEVHSRTFTTTVSQTIRLQVATDLETDATIVVVDENGTAVTGQNLAPTGEVEALLDLSLPQAGRYHVHVHAPDGTPGYYAMMLLDGDSYSFLFQGTLNYGSSAGVSLAAETDHFWHFSGNAGETVTVTIVPGNNEDMFIELYDPTGNWLGDFVDETGAGETESHTYTLPSSGLYSVRTGEFDFRAGSYQVQLSQN